jgi:hypothetical protein
VADDLQYRLSIGWMNSSGTTGRAPEYDAWALREGQKCRRRDLNPHAS